VGEPPRDGTWTILTFFLDLLDENTMFGLIQLLVIRIVVTTGHSLASNLDIELTSLGTQTLQPLILASRDSH
jgi:hypothetical protein